MPSSSCWPHSEQQTHSRSLAPPPSGNLVGLRIQVLAASSKSQRQQWTAPPKSSGQGLRRVSLLIVTFEDPFSLPVEQLSVMMTNLCLALLPLLSVKKTPRGRWLREKSAQCTRSGPQHVCKKLDSVAEMWLGYRVANHRPRELTGLKKQLGQR